MFVTILLLAQLVLPGPPSGPIQPTGMICLGECAGPVVWGPAERGRLVVACDMTSDTCSDGRKITTTRATPVPCEVAPGVWEMVPEDTGCYSVRGLESWAATTSYLSYGAELDRSPWVTLQGGEVQQLPHGYRVTGSNIELSRVLQIIPPDAGTWTFACVADTGASIGARLRFYQEGGAGSRFCNLDSVPGFQTHSCTTTITGTPTHLSVNIYPGSGHVDVAGCWLTRTDTPGRPCWGGEAPVTCADDRHTIGTEGWPTTEGEISITFTVGESTVHRYIIDGRAAGDTARSILMVSNQGLLRLYRPDGSFATGPAVTLGVQHVVRLRLSEGRTKVFLDGVEVMDVSGTLSWAPTATIGRHYTLPNEALNGSISSLRIRSTP